MGTSPIKYREAIYAYPHKFIGWNYWGWIDGEWVAPESNDPKASYMYTGQADYAGKEIYDGDITEIISNFPAVVTYGECGGTQGFYLCELGIESGANAPETHDMFCFFHPVCKTGFRIKGNIVENPGYRWRARKFLKLLNSAQKVEL